MKLDKGNGVTQAVESTKKRVKEGEAADEKESELSFKFVGCVLMLVSDHSNPLVHLLPLSIFIITSLSFLN